METSLFIRLKCVLAKRNAGLTTAGYKVNVVYLYYIFRWCLATSTAFAAAGSKDGWTDSPTHAARTSLLLLLLCYLRSTRGPWSDDRRCIIRVACTSLCL